MNGELPNPDDPPVSSPPTTNASYWIGICIANTWFQVIGAEAGTVCPLAWLSVWLASTRSRDCSNSGMVSPIDADGLGRAFWSIIQATKIAETCGGRARALR